MIERGSPMRFGARYVEALGDQLDGARIDIAKRTLQRMKDRQHGAFQMAQILNDGAGRSLVPADLCKQYFLRIPIWAAVYGSVVGAKRKIFKSFFAKER